MPVEDLYYKKYLKYKNKYLNLQSQMGGMRRANDMYRNKPRDWDMVRGPAPQPQQGIPAPQPQQGIPAPQQPQQIQWIEPERRQARVEKQLQATREQAAREQEAREQAQAAQAAWRVRKQAQWGTQEKEKWIAENERQKEEANADVLIHITALRNALTQAQQEAAEKAVIYVNNWEINGKMLFDNYVNRLDKKQYPAAKVYVKEIAIAFKEIENDLKKMQERMQEGIQKEESNKEIKIKTLFKESLLTMWDNMRSKNNLISKKIELELGSEIKIHEEDNKYLTNSNHVYMSKNIPGNTTDLRSMLLLVQNKNTQEDRRLVSVVVPQYPDYDDTQFAITGSCKAGEDIEKAVQREILEEIGFFVDISNITKLYVKSSVTYFHVTLENSIKPSEANLQQATEMVEMAKMDKFDDDKTNKVCIIMTMTLNETNINKIYGRKRSTSSDIAGKTIAIIPLEKMIEFTDKAEFPEKQKRSYH
jgi:predicted NUDIX family NTP pyrophosphohydrolase